MSDQKQEARIEALEIQLAQMEARLETAHTRSTDGSLMSQPEEAAPTQHKPEARRQGQSTVRTNRQNHAEPATATSKIETLADKLTDDNRKNSKFETPVRLELNTIDSLTLIRVPGIAGRTAATILDYRQRLGGFYSPEQLREKLTWEAAQDYLDTWCNDWFIADESQMQMLRINKLSFKEINNHPYINYEQTRALVRYREKHHGIRSMNELRQLEEFDDATLEKLSHYLSFEP